MEEEDEVSLQQLVHKFDECIINDESDMSFVDDTTHGCLLMSDLTTDDENKVSKKLAFIDSVQQQVHSDTHIDECAIESKDSYEDGSNSLSINCSLQPFQISTIPRANKVPIELVCSCHDMISKLSLWLDNSRVTALVELMSRLSTMSDLVEAHRQRYKREGNKSASQYLTTITNALSSQRDLSVVDCIPELELHQLLGDGSDGVQLSCSELVLQLELLVQAGLQLVDQCFEYYAAHQTDIIPLESASVTSRSRSVASRSKSESRSPRSASRGSPRSPRSPPKIKGVLPQLVSNQKTLSKLVQRWTALLYAPAQPALNRQLNTMLSVDVTLSLVCNAMFDSGAPSVAILLLKLQSTSLLKAVYTSWPDLTLRIPVFNNDIITAAVPLQLRSPISLTQTKVGSGVSILTFHRKPKTTSAEDQDRTHKLAFTTRAGSTSSANTPMSPVRRKQSGVLSPGGGRRNKNTIHTPITTTNSTQIVDDNISPAHNFMTSLASAARPHTPSKTEEALDSSAVTLSQRAALIDLSNLTGADLSSSRALRTVGFSARQLFDSGSFTAAQLLSAGYALSQLHAISTLEFSVPDLRAAGYSVLQCAQAGYNLPELYCGGCGYNALELVNSELFSVAQLRSVGCDPQRFALVTIFEQMGGSQWKTATNWDTCWPLCEWYGVTLNADGEVVKLKLNGNYLKGHLPSAISLLTSLKHLDMRDNKVGGALPDSLRKLMELKELVLCNNLLSDHDRSAVQSMLPTCHIRL